MDNFIQPERDRAKGKRVIDKKKKNAKYIKRKKVEIESEEELHILQ